MTEIVIWGGDAYGNPDHKDRAEQLATTYSTIAIGVTQAPRKIASLSTLVFWGHGDIKKFCNLTPDEFLALVSSWKKLNPGIDTVEMLTCNARHKQGGNTDSYTGQVVAKLNTKQSKIRFRGFPLLSTPTGNTCQFSILKWHPTTTTWAYVGASGLNDDVMQNACRVLQVLMPPKGTHMGYVRAHTAMKDLKPLKLKHQLAQKLKYGQEQVDKFNTDLEGIRRDATVMSGTLSMLRWCITDIK
ncbi:MAG: hypothetical protein K0Q76_2750 [Panacagrimonas sp.]|jgi:hypothetical protein|nr:hypothetical protein [Panacagrimonas sp.]MCC2657642.1 hypothetical protein [Panacagrimonas sp.]